MIRPIVTDEFWAITPQLRYILPSHEDTFVSLRDDPLATTVADWLAHQLSHAPVGA